MTAKYYRTKRFIDLQNVWYDKLILSGFNDLEHLDQNTGLGADTPYLRRPLSKFHNLTPSDVSQRLEYFSAAQDFTDSHNFTTLLHKLIWTEYTKGTTQREIIRIADENRFKSISIFWVSTELAKLKKAFSLWQLDQPDTDQTLDEFIQSNNAVD
jgi:hypothetical protein